MFIGDNHGVRPPPTNRDRDLVGVVLQGPDHNYHYMVLGTPVLSPHYGDTPSNKKQSTLNFRKHLIFCGH